MLSNKGKYGLKALLHLAGLPAGSVIAGSEIADANNIPKKFLDAILNDLKRAGLVHAKKGPGGGYSLARPAKDVMIGQAIRVMDGALAPIACASRNFYRPCDDCRDVATCSVRLLMLEARDAMAGILDNTSLADLRRRVSDDSGLLRRTSRRRKSRVLAA